MIALVVLLLLGAPDDAATASWRDIERFVKSAPAEPEPPPGLRAPAGTERYERAQRVYAELLRVWRRARARYESDLLIRCTKHRKAYPDAYVHEVLHVEADLRFQMGQYRLARDLWFRLYDDGVKSVKPQLAAACRGMGDYKAALVYGGRTPEALEEAGKVDQAIAAARRAGRLDLAESWGLIGKPPPALGKIPQHTGPAILLVRQVLPEPVKKALLTASVGKIPIFSFSDGRSAIYLVDSKGLVRAVNPRLDTLQHRIKHLLTIR